MDLLIISEDLTDNQLLSERRAQAVMDVGFEQGISLSRVSYNGYGESFPVADNATE